MKKLILLFIIAIYPIATFSASSNQNFWGWTSYTNGYGEQYVYSYKFYNEYSCTVKQRYDYYNSPNINFVHGTYNRIYCSVKNYECTCIYK